jgi:hypothetical protein
LLFFGGELRLIQFAFFAITKAEYVYIVKYNVLGRKHFLADQVAGQAETLAIGQALC